MQTETDKITSMILKLNTDGSESAVEMKDIRQGDVFRTVDAQFSGPYLRATANANRGPHPRDPSRKVWGCKVEIHIGSEGPSACVH